ncbi:Caspase domain protein [Streptomyces reticuli]|nr:Caspase domain protein [Streptomyces reticuli]
MHGPPDTPVRGLPAPSAHVLPDPAASRAVLIAVDTYRAVDGHAAMEPLPSVARGAKRLAHLLRDPAVWGLPRKHCVLLSNPARPDTVLEAVSRAARAATDTLLVYFAGHGWLETDNDLCLMLPGSHPDHLIRALKYRDLRSVLLARRRAHSQVVILDSCFSGTAVTGFMGGGFAGGGQTVAHHALVDRTYLMTACAPQELAYAPPDEPYPAFTGELIRTLEHGIPGAPDPLPMDAVFRQLRDALSAKQRPRPQASAINVGHEIALARNRARTPPHPERRPLPPPPAAPAAHRWWRRPSLWLPPALLLTASLAAVPLVPLLTGSGNETARPPLNRDTDPCTLTAPAALARYGETEQDPAYGGFDRCDVLVHRPDGGTVDVRVELDPATPETTEPARTVGSVKVLKTPPDDGTCERRLAPSGEDATVTISAKDDGEGGDGDDPPLCEMADTATNSALAALNEGKVRPRTTPFPANSLFHRNACALIDPTALHAGPPRPGFANWLCRYSSTTTDLDAVIFFDRGQPPSPTDGTPTRIRDHRALLHPEPDGPHTFQVQITQRTYTDTRNRELTETLNIVLSGNAPQKSLRALAVTLADTATAKLPKPT